MDAQRYPRSPHTLPEINIQSMEHYYSSSYQNASSHISSPSVSNATEAMSIVNPRKLSPPPPLSQPKHTNIEQQGHECSQFDANWQWENARIRESNWDKSPSTSYAQQSTLYGSLSHNGRNLMDDRPEPDRRFSSSSTVKSVSGMQARMEAFPRSIDEGYASLAGTSNLSNQDDRDARQGFQSSMHQMFQNTASNYDISLLKKLDTRRGSGDATPPREKNRHVLNSSLNDGDSRIPKYDTERASSVSLPSVTTITESIAGPASQRIEGAPALSSRTSISSNQLRVDTKNSKDRSDSIVFRPSHLSKTSVKLDDEKSNDSHSSGGSCDRSLLEIDPDYPVEETRRLQLDDRSHRDQHFTIGQKRRASSPPREDTLPPLHTVGSASDLFRRRESASRASPIPRVHSNHGSFSSIASGPRSNSYTSTFSLAPSSISTLSSGQGRFSPGGISPGGLSSGLPSLGGMSSGGFPSSGLSPAISLIPGTLSPRTPDDNIESPFTSPRDSSIHSTYHRTVSFDARHLPASRKASVDVPGFSAQQGGFICECCPKKPKKFETIEELTLHEGEKQYECLYCKNRFKNKNEMERHQNSLHLRHHSWSCAALTGYAAAFHVSQTRDDADTCGYCGEDFSRTGQVDRERGTVMASARDWELRTQHLSEVHKFGECNHAKKFYRADHFRQHLKHSHAGTSGKWTNVLENACMKDEPIPRIRQEILN